MGEARLQRTLRSRSAPQPCGGTEMKGPSSPSTPSSPRPASGERARSEQGAAYPRLSYSRGSGRLCLSLSAGRRARKPNRSRDGGGPRATPDTEGPSRVHRLPPWRCGPGAGGPDGSPIRGGSGNAVRAGGRRLPAPHRAHPAPRAPRGSKSQTIEERRKEGNRSSLTRPLSPLRGPNRGSGAVLSAGAAPDFPPARSGPVVASLGRRRTGDGGGQRGVSVRGPSRGGPSPAGSEGAALLPPPPQCRSSAAVEGRSVKPGRRESPRHKKATDGPWCSFNTFYYSSVRITLQTYHEKG